jgi:metal-sulfur cluster biosynthetic enzyme
VTSEEENILKEKVVEVIKTIYDPEIPVNLYDLGLIYDIKFEVLDNYTHCLIDMTLTSPGCSVADSLVEQVRYFAASIDLVDEAHVNLVFDPPWESEMISDDGKDLLALHGTVF